MDGHAIPWNPTSIKDAEKKAKNNIYVKNIPDTWTDAKLKEVFGAYGNISSAILMNHANGKFGFICFQDPNGKDHNYGPQCGMKAVEALNGKKFDDKELFVTFAQSQIQRKIEVQKQIINLKTSKKRCNLLVRGFGENWGEQEIRNVFEQFGKIENIKLLQTKNTNAPHSAFVCYEQPSEASEAKLKLHGKQFEGKVLEIK
jgi:polyadenylate-binding protein